jgi:hypothetical protein
MKNLIIIITQFLLSSSLLAVEKGEFKYKSKMIHPLCIDHFTTMERMKNRRIDKNLKALGTFYKRNEGPTEIQLSKCHDVSKNFTSEKDGTQNYSPNSKTREIFEYKVLLNLPDNNFLLKTLWNGGGSGYFSDLIVFKIDEEKLIIVSEGKGIGGDRCNGGIRIKNIRNNSFTLVKNLTPIDLVELSQSSKIHKLKAYEDLESSAMSCVATKNTQFHIENDQLKSKLLGYNITGISNEDIRWVKKFKYQNCFNKEFKQFKGKLKSKLATQKNVNDFVSQFTSRCIKTKL